MSDYVKSTNFASKDTLSSGNPLKIVKGTEIDTEFTNIATAVATKLDSASPTITGGTIDNTTIGATTASTGAFTTLAASGNVTLSGGTANGVAYLNGSKVVTSGSSLVFDGTNLGLGVTPSAWGIGKALQVNNASLMGYLNRLYANANTYFDGTGTGKYIASDYATSYQQLSGQHQWFTAPSGTAGNAISFTQAMTLDANGRLNVGATSFGYAVRAGFRGDSSSVATVEIQNESSTGTMLTFRTNGESQVGSVSFTSGGVLYNVTSDQRLKENIVDAPEFGSVIDSIKVRSYDWKANGSHQRAGFIAQELVTVAPEAVHQPADTDEMMAVDYSKLVPMLVKEIQSLRKRLATLESK